MLPYICRSRYTPTEVELFIDGISLGKQKTENYTATFEVPFSNRNPFLFAQGNYQGKTVQDGLRINFTPIPACLDANNLKGLELAVNVGSQCFFTSDESQLTWLPDQPYAAGSWGYIGGKEGTAQTEIQNTADGPLFQTLRNEIEGYRFDAPQGVYEIELLFPISSAGMRALPTNWTGTGNKRTGKAHSAFP